MMQEVAGRNKRLTQVISCLLCAISCLQLLMGRIKDTAEAAAAGGQTTDGL